MRGSHARWRGRYRRCPRDFPLCRRRDLPVLHIRRVDETCFTCRVRPGVLAVLRQERRRMGCRVTVQEKVGLPFRLIRAKRRWTLPAAVRL